MPATTLQQALRIRFHHGGTESTESTESTENGTAHFFLQLYQRDSINQPGDGATRLPREPGKKTNNAARVETSKSEKPLSRDNFFEQERAERTEREPKPFLSDCGVQPHTPIGDSVSQPATVESSLYPSPFSRFAFCSICLDSAQYNSVGVARIFNQIPSVVRILRTTLG